MDVNILSRIISSAKTTWLGNRHDVIEKAKNILDGSQKSELRDDFIYSLDFKKYMIGYWFKPDSVMRLETIAAEIRSMRQSKIKTLFQCVFSATVRDSSLTYRNEVRLHRLRPDDMAKFNPDIDFIFMKRLRSAMDGIGSLPKGSSADIRHGSVLKMPFGDGEFSTIICSPPYGDERNGVSYNQFSKNMLYWLGVPKAVYDDNRRQFLGWYDRNNVKPIPDTPTLNELHDSFDNEVSRAELSAFYHDYNLALREMVRVTSDKIVIVIGNRVLNNRVVNNARITTELFSNHQMRLVNHFIRDLPSKRIPRFGKISNVNGGCIDREDILVYKQVR